jgi:4-hydroxy-tetrahydrodipicolinate synthase
MAMPGLPGQASLGGVFAPVLTPFAADLAPDVERLAAQCRRLLGQGVGLALFGTTSEGNSLSLGERMWLLESLAERGVALGAALAGTGCCALTDTVRLTRFALEQGCAGVLMLPPFYYKPVGDDGLYTYYSEVIERVADDRLRIVLYHIPPLAGVGISAPLVSRLRAAYPATLAGLKDSGGDWEYTRSMIEAQGPDFAVFCGSEGFLLRTMAAGGRGCISALANVNPGPIAALCRDWREAGAPARQQGLDAIRAVFAGHPLIAALKAALAYSRADPAWRTVRPPLVELSAHEAARLAGELQHAGLVMAGEGTG